MTEKEIKNVEVLNDFDKDIFLEKYAMKEISSDKKRIINLEFEPSQAFRRIAKTLAEKFYTNLLDEQKPTKNSVELTESSFYNVMAERRGILAGRSLIALGNSVANLTAMNCFVVPVDDSIEGILGGNFQGAAKIQQAGGGFGTNFSNIRPYGATVKGVTSTASGPISFMHTWDSMIATMRSAGHRRGAGMAILDVDHPDIIEFITAKQNSSRLTNFNISVAITDEFIKALKDDKEIELKHDGKTYGKIRAKVIFDKIVENAYDYNEPGLFFKDRTNDVSNSWYYQKLNATNPCGEVPLPDFGVCCLGMIILSTFVKEPFISSDVNWESLQKTTKTLVFMLDTVLDAANYPVKQTEKVAMQDRRIGLGITGLADMLAMLKIKYDSDEAVKFVDKMMNIIRNAAYEASIELSKLKGPFPKFNAEKYLQGKQIQALPEYLKTEIETYGIRNVCIMTCQPAGTISLLLHNVSSGIEPIFSLKQKRRMRDERGNLTRSLELLNYAYRYYKAHGFDKIYGEKPDFFQTAKNVSLQGHFEMQNKIQEYVDNSISKTINFPENTDFDSFKSFMYDVVIKPSHVKGMTTFREGTIQSILVDDDDSGRIFSAENGHRKRSFTYQVKRSSGLPAIYIHVTYIKNYIAQVFIDTRDIDFYKTALPYTRLLSIMFTKEKNLEKLLELLQELEDMDYIEGDENFIYKGQTYHHFLAAIKECIWDCLVELNLIKNDDKDDIRNEEESPGCSKGTCET